MPLFSICIPTYNMAHWLPEAIESALNQTDGDFEILIGDNASTDDTTTVLTRYSGDSRVKVFRHEQNIGAYANTNFLLRKAQGAWLHCLCADDAMSPICLEMVRKYSTMAPLVAMNSSKDKMSVVADPRATVAHHYPVGKFLFCLNETPVPLGIVQLFVKREVMEENGFYKEISMEEDYGTDSYAGWEMFLKHGCVHIPTTLIYERYHPTQGRFTQGAYKGVRDYFKFFANYDTRLRELPGYPYEIERFKDRTAAQHLCGGLRRFLINRNPTYLLETRRVLAQHGYRRWPLAAMAACLVRQLTNE